MMALRSLSVSCRRRPLAAAPVAQRVEHDDNFGVLSQHISWTTTISATTIAMSNKRFLSSSSSSLKKRRRKPKELASSKKDKIRLYEKIPQDSKSLFPTPSPEEAIDNAESKMLTIRNAVYSFWSTGGSSIVPTIVGTGALVRPERVGPTMDGRWWFWNICLALMPATVIGLYCEFVAKAEAEEYYKAQTARQKEKMGIDTDPKQKQGGAIPFGQDVSLVKDDKGYLEKAQGALQLVTYLFSSNLPSDESLTDNDNDMKSTAVPEDVSPQQLVHNESDNVYESIQGPDLPNEDSETNRLIEMIGRIEALEAELAIQNKRKDQKIKYQQQRANQSGIQNRREDNLLVEWQKKEVEEAEMNDDKNKSLTEEMKEAALHGITEYFSSQKERIQLYSDDLMNQARGTLGRTKDNNENGNNKVDGDPSHENIVKSVEEVASASNRVAHKVVSSVSTSDSAVGSQKVETAALATEASEAALQGLSSVSASAPSNETKPGFLMKSWSKLVRGRPGKSFPAEAKETTVDPPKE